MDKKTIGMIVGAVLAALLTVKGLNIFVDMLYPASGLPGMAQDKPAKAEAQKPATPEAPKAAATEDSSGAKTAANEAAPAAAEPEKPLAALLAAANTDAGAAEAKKCTACHTFEKGGPAKVGPNLYGIVGRPVGTRENFAYSPAVGSHGGNWDYKLLNCYIKDPKACVPGNRMAFMGIRNDSDRANVIAFLRSLSDSPVPLPAQ